MDRQRDSAKNAPALRVVGLIALASISAILVAPVAAAPMGNTARDRSGHPALRSVLPLPNIPTPNQRVTVHLPITTLDNGIPIETVFFEPVVTTNIDPNRRYVGFQADFTFDQLVVTFSPPYVESAGITAPNWSVAANILPGSGPIRILRVSGISVDQTPLNGTGVLYNLRMLRVSGTAATITGLTWRPYPNNFLFFDDRLNEFLPDQTDGLVTITGAGPTATPSPVPVPTPCAPLSQGFDNIFTLVQDYWVIRNNSQPRGDTIWLQGDSTVFPPQSGGVDSFIAANFQNGAGVATISNWLLTPPLELHDGARLTFFTRTVAVRVQPDRLQVRMSTSGDSFDVGTTAESVGDFTTLLLDINPTYTVTDYPNVWTQFTAVVSGLGTRTTGRLAFRYFVENGGPEGANSNYIGLDTVEYSSCDEPTPSPTPEAPTPTPGEFCRAFITQSASQEITVGNSVACVGSPPFHDHFDNSYWRAFDMGPLTGGEPYYVASVSFGIEVARAGGSSGTQPIVVRLYGQTTGEFPGGSRTQLAMVSIDLADQEETVLTVPLAATVPAAASQLIMEVFSPDGQPPIDNSFFVGSNAAGQSGPSYMSTQTCEYPEPTDLAVLGFPNMHLVFDITGTCTAPTPTPIPTPRTRALNLSTRVRVETGNDVGIAGFIITGIAPKQVLLRGIGPSLGSAGVSNPLADPLLELHGSAGPVIMTNNNWRDTQEAQIIATGIAPASDLESAILMTLNPGAYTAILRGNDGGAGVGLVEIYDLGQGNISKLANISTRGIVGTGSDMVIAGFLLAGGSGDDLIFLHGVGPSLTHSGVTNALSNPALELRNGDGTVVASNDDWQNGPSISLPPGDPLESAIEATLPPGAYTALLSGVNNGVGVGLVEVYDRGSP